MPTEAAGQATPPAGTFASVSAGGGHTCALKTDGTIACWGSDRYMEATSPPGTFISVSAGYDQTCGVKTDGSVECWGNNDWKQSTCGEASQIDA